VDVYYEMEGKETVSEYCQDSTGEEGMRVDPLTLGCVNAETPTHDAREYFLKVSLIRLNQVKREWQQIVGRFKHEVRAYEEVCCRLLLPSIAVLSPSLSLKQSVAHAS